MNELEAIKILHKMCSDLAKCYANTIDKRNALGISIKALEKQSSGGWIPCSERLPELDDEGNSEFVQVTIHTPTASITDKFVTEAWYSEKENNWYPRGNGLCIGRVIAWQPLPQPYKE